ncbi:hypothetical protein FRB95_011590 [Tulasnella sp. JGI-2019a]|nr:hypothetical protein FRB95_011590 [Tulasnella sp. JGI-2019a]
MSDLDSPENPQKPIAIDSKLAFDEPPSSLPSTGAYMASASGGDKVAPDEKIGGWSSTDGEGEAAAEHNAPTDLANHHFLPVIPSEWDTYADRDCWAPSFSDQYADALHRSARPGGNSAGIWRRESNGRWECQADAELEHVLEMSRNESGVALTALTIIESTIMNQNVDGISASTMLEELRLECLQADVSFAELLDKCIEGYGMPPLAIETSRCDFEGAPDLLFFLAEHTASAKKMEYIIQGCMLRKDNLFEKLQPMIGPSANRDAPQAFEYVVSSEQYATPYTSVVPDKRPPNTFRALISIPNFAIALQKRATELDIRRQHTWMRSPGSEDSSSINDAGLVIELVALGRYWTLMIGRNRLALSLMDGQECNVDASLSVIEEQLGDLAPAVLYSLENPGAPIPEKIPPPALCSAPAPPSPVRECNVNANLSAIEEQLRDPAPAMLYSFENLGAPIPGDIPTLVHFSVPPQSAPIIATTPGDSTFDKPTSTYVELIKWTISYSPDNRATVVDICKQIAQQHPYYNDNTHFATLKSAVRQRLTQKPYFRFIVGQEGKRQGWTYDDLLDKRDTDEEAARKGEHLEHDLYESELADTLAAVVIDEAKAPEATGGPSSEVKSKTPSDLLMIPASNPSSNPIPPAEETAPAAITGTPGSFFFPPTTLHTLKNWQGGRACHVEIPRCFPSNSKPSSFMDVTLQSHQLLVQLVVRLYDERDGPETLDPSIHAKIPSSIGATGPGSSFVGSSVANRSNAGSSSTGGWSVVHDDDMFDTDGTEKGDEDSGGDSTEDDESGFSDLG